MERREISLPFQTSALDDGKQRTSIKRSFMRKVLSPVIGYGSDFTLLQFVYDLSLWTGIGGKKNATRGIPFRIAMKGFSFTPMYWRRVLAGIIDLSRQLGMPKFLWTFAPYEWS